MKFLLIVAVISTFAYSSIGALMKAVETQKSHIEKINSAKLLTK